jgi:enoyl-CoA hydratase/carnithine racemase
LTVDASVPSHRERDGAIATVTLANPDKLNAVTAAMWRQLKQAMDELSADDALRCVILRGEGHVFASGGDIEEFHTLRATLAQARIYHDEWVAGALDSISLCRHPAVAMIEGSCIGGGLEIAAACDLRICGRSARFGAPINRLGFSMAYGELKRLLTLLGPAMLNEMLLEGRLLSADEAYAKGLVTRVVDNDMVVAEVLATARRIAAGSPLVARTHKRLIRRLTTDPKPLNEREITASFAFLDSDDYREGLAAFRAKRKPVFNGR